MDKHWTEKMFVDYPELFQPQLESLQEEAVTEVNSIKEMLREAGVPDDGLILDLGCGIGRHALLLAEHGFNVVGVDISPNFIAYAEGIAEKRGVQENTRFIVGDMRIIKKVLSDYTGRFNSCINFFTSLGYWDRDTDRRILAQLFDLSASKGVFIIDITNRDWIVKNFLRTDLMYHPKGLVQTVERMMDLETSRMHNLWKYYHNIDNGLKHIVTFEVDHILYSLHELKALVESVGWKYQICYGGFNREQAETNSRRLVLVAQKH